MMTPFLVPKDKIGNIVWLETTLLKSIDVKIKKGNTEPLDIVQKIDQLSSSCKYRSMTVQYLIKDKEKSLLIEKINYKKLLMRELKKLMLKKLPELAKPKEGPFTIK